MSAPTPCRPMPAGIDAFVDWIHCADCSTWLPAIPDQSIDVILTDPPYIGDQYEAAYQVLADHAGRVLRPSGYLVTYAGQYHLERTMQILAGAGLGWYWMVAQENNGPCTVVHCRNILARYKPILVYQKPLARPSPRMLFDRVNGKQSKSHHVWEQAIGDSLALLGALARPGAVVLDPFAGSGTALLAAKLLGLHWIGFEMNPAHVATARSRLAQEPIDIWFSSPENP